MTNLRQHRVTGSPRIRIQYVIAFIALLPEGLRQNEGPLSRVFFTY